MNLHLYVTRELLENVNLPLDISKIKNNLLFFSNAFVIDQIFYAMFIKISDILQTSR